MASSQLSPQQVYHIELNRTAALKRRLSCIENHLVDISDSRGRIYLELAELNRIKQGLVRKKSKIIADILGTLVDLDRQVIDHLPIAARAQRRVIVELSDAVSHDELPPSQLGRPDQDCAASAPVQDAGAAQHPDVGEPVEQRRDDAAESKEE